MKDQRFKFKDNGGNTFIVYASNRNEAYLKAKSQSLCYTLYFVD